MNISFNTANAILIFLRESLVFIKDVLKMCLIVRRQHDVALKTEKKREFVSDTHLSLQGGFCIFQRRVGVKGQSPTQLPGHSEGLLQRTVAQLSWTGGVHG